MSLEIVIKTSDVENLKEQRFCNVNKKTVSLKCISSILFAVGGRQESTKITIVDNASDENHVKSIKKMLENYTHPSELITLDKKDENNARLQQLELAKESDKTFVYCVDDECLHFPNAIAEVEYFYKHAFSSLNRLKDIVICPIDDPANYLSIYNMEPCNIVQYGSRHWRTNRHGKCVFFTTPSVINRGWAYFEKFANDHGKDPAINEETTIDHVWNLQNVQMFTPMPSLALQMGNEVSRDKMVDWNTLWQNTETFI